MQTVIETPPYLAQARDAGLGREECAAIVSIVAENPEAGQPMVGTGGCRKLRFARSGRGKSGGIRVITFFSGPRIPVFLLAVFAKGEKANLTKGERNDLAKLGKRLIEAYARR